MSDNEESMIDERLNREQGEVNTVSQLGSLIQFTSKKPSVEDRIADLTKAVKELTKVIKNKR